jgi:uncharacterized OB-fold protein
MAVRPKPAPDTMSEPFWKAVAKQKLEVQRCENCLRYQHPPKPFCFTCHSEAVSFVEISGKGVVYSYTETSSGARHPYWQEQSPYLTGTVELDEQDGLFMASNFPDSRLEDLRIGKRVKVEFQKLDDGSYLPQFRLVADGDN